MKKDLVSVIVPVFKAEKFLERCVSSILSQTYENFELILVDDGSPDGSPALCDTLAKTDKRIIVIHKENGGPSSARNAGLEKAKGEYVCFVDSDDAVDERYVELLHESIVSKNSDISICNITVEKKPNSFVEEGFKTNEVINLKQNPKFIYDLYMSENLMPPCCKMYKKILISTKFPEKISYGEDEIFNLNYLKNTEIVSTVNTSLYTYFLNKNSITHTNKTELVKKRAETIIDRYNLIKSISNDKNIAGYCCSYPLFRQIYYMIDDLLYLNYKAKEILKILRELVANDNVKFAMEVYFPFDKKTAFTCKNLKKNHFKLLIFVRKLALLKHKLRGKHENI